MGILYGAMLANLIPTLLHWFRLPTALVVAPAPVSDWLHITLSVMALGVLLSGLRDLYAAFDLPYSGWPWTKRNHPP